MNILNLISNSIEGAKGPENPPIKKTNQKNYNKSMKKYGNKNKNNYNKSMMKIRNDNQELFNKQKSKYTDKNSTNLLKKK